MTETEFRKSLNQAIANCSYKFTDLHTAFHRRSIEQMTDVTKIVMDRSFTQIFKTQEVTTWIVSINFSPCKNDFANFSRYAIGIYELTGISWIRFAYEDNRWDVQVTEKQKLGE